MNKKIILFDLDDTLLTSEKKITSLTAEAVKACKARGMYIGYLTARARPPKEKGFFIDHLPCDFIAYYNGAEIYAGGTSIESNTIAYQDAVKMIADIKKEYPNTTVGVSLEPFSFKKGEIWNIDTGEKFKCDLSELPHCNVQRIRIAFHKNEDMSLNDFMTDQTIFFSTSDGTAIIINKNATKEHALKKAAEWFHVPLSEVIAFGDDVNDIGMLMAAGVGVAMGNAINSVKEIADFITETNDDEGISIWINRHLLADGRLNIL